MENKVYHSTLKTMHEAGVDKNYYHGWAAGALGNTPLEEQRVTDAYTAGFDDGSNGVQDGYLKWLETSA